jgi:hypothetical protein
LKLYRRLLDLTEEQLRRLMVNFFLEQGFLAEDTHSSSEHGADIIVTVNEGEDILGIGQLLFIQLKSTDVKLSFWKKNLFAQLLELRVRPPILLNSSKIASRRVVLMTSGKIHQQVVEEINHTNEKDQIPFEVLDGKRIAKLLFDRKYPPKQIDNDIKDYRVLQVGKIDYDSKKIAVRKGPDKTTSKPKLKKIGLR